jgi:hypothetical protein
MVAGRPEHTAGSETVISIAGKGLTIMVLPADTGVHVPPVVVNVRVARPLYPAGGVQVAFKSVAAGVKVPPSVVDHIPPVAEPPVLPPSGAEVPPWHIAVSAAPALAVGAGITTCVLFAVAVPQAPPLVVSINVAVPLYPEGGVHVAFISVSAGIKVPPAAVDHVPPVAEPPTLPPKGAEVPPWHIEGSAAPALAEGDGVTT